MKEGTIIPYQDTNEKRFDTTTNLIEDDGLDLLIYPDSNGFAEGTLYIDNNGDSESDFESNRFEYYKIRFSQRTITIDLIDGLGSSGDLTKGNHIIENIYIFDQSNVSLELSLICQMSSFIVFKMRFLIVFLISF